MAENRTHIASRNLWWGVMNKISSNVFPFITRTVIIYTMGMQYAGLGSLFVSILQVLSLAELGVGNALVFSMYKPIAEGDRDTVCALLNFYKKTYRAIGIVVLLLGFLVLPFLEMLVVGDIPENINMQKLFMLYLLDNVLSYFLFAYKQSLLIAFQRMDRINKIIIIVKTVSGICQIAVLLLTQNYYLFVIVLPVSTCINNICMAAAVHKYYPQYVCSGIIQQAELTAIKKKIGGMVFQKIGGIILSSVDTIIISSFLGLTCLALYQNYYYVVTALFSFFSVMMESVTAVIGNSIVTESVWKNYADFKKFNLMYIWIVVWCSACMITMYQPFIQIWVGQNAMFGMKMTSLFVIYFFVHKWCDMLFVYQEACGIWWETRAVPLIAAIVNLVINIILVQIIGLAGILISTIISIVFVYNIGYARVLFHTYFKSVKGLKEYWFRQVFYFLTGTVVIGCTLMVCNLYKFHSPVLQFAVNGSICAVWPNLLMLVMWHRLPEFKASFITLRDIARKK